MAKKDTEARREAARLLGRAGGLKGGPATAKKLSKAERSANAKRAADARWEEERRRRIDERLAELDDEPSSDTLPPAA